ncbi:MAG: hypothetical protein FIA97_09750 [Methylococcaceae bacterium]|nr:hypothetical protein [Methylococcaceae bacterium]
MNDETAYFLLGEPFRWSLIGQDDGEENDEDSVVNDLELYLGNYEFVWGGETLETPFEHWDWDQLRRVVRVRRNSAAVGQEIASELQEAQDLAVVSLPSDTRLESAIWIVKAVMRKRASLPASADP